MKRTLIALFIASISILSVACNNSNPPATNDANTAPNNVTTEPNNVNPATNNADAVPNNTSTATNESNPTPNNAKISEKQAKDIALKHAKLTSDKVRFNVTEYDTDNGYPKYDIEFYYNNQEYSYEIDANTGEILSHSIEKQ